MSITRILGKLTPFLPIADWLPKYKGSFVRWDLVAGLTLASFVLPESMAYATLAGVPTYFGIYCYLIAGIGFALFTTSRQVVVGPTSSISLMVGSTLAILAAGDPIRWVELASFTTLVVALIYLVAFLLKLSAIANFISDTILLGFKAGAALSIMATQLPKLFGVEASRGNFFTRIASLLEHITETNYTVLVFGLVALAVLIAGDFFWKGKPVSLVLVIAVIVLMSSTHLASAGVHIIGSIPGGMPKIAAPPILFHELENVLDLAFACFLMGYIETISAARTFAMEKDYRITPRQELLSLAMANLAAAFSSSYVVSGGLSQSTVNERSGAKTPLSLIICSLTLGVTLLCLTSFLKNLPEVILAVIVLHAVSGLIKIGELKKLRLLNRQEFFVALMAIAAVLVLGILKGVIVSVLISLVLLIRRTSNPQVAILGRIGNTGQFSDIRRHPDNIQIPGVVIARVESSILYFNAENILQKINHHLNQGQPDCTLLILDMSASPYVDVAGSKMLVNLAQALKKEGKQIRLIQALSNVREILRKQGLEELTGHISRSASISAVLSDLKPGSGS